MVNREASRIRKFRQVGLVHVEPALKWWKRQNCFFKFVPIVVKVFPTKVEAEVSETMLQRVAKPELNFPLVHKLLGIYRLSS